MRWDGLGHHEVLRNNLFFEIIHKKTIKFERHPQFIIFLYNHHHLYLSYPGQRHGCWILYYKFDDHEVFLVADDTPRLDQVDNGIAGGALDHSHGEGFRFLEHCEVLRDKHLSVEFDSHGLVEIDLGDHCLDGWFNHHAL